MAVTVLEKEARVTLDGGAGRLAVVADTHSRPHPALGARLEALRPAAILHAGDIGDLGVLDELARHAPVFAVRGNIDERGRDLPDLLVLDVGHLRVLVLHIGLSGTRLAADVARKARAVGAQLVVCGHSHIPFIGQERGLTVFNPGSIGPRRFSLPIVLGTIDVAPGQVRLAHIDAATGARWSPP